MKLIASRLKRYLLGDEQDLLNGPDSMGLAVREQLKNCVLDPKHLGPEDADTVASMVGHLLGTAGHSFPDGEELPA